MKLEFPRQILEKYSNIKFHENPSSRSRVVPCGRTDMTKLTVGFRNFANAPQRRHTACHYKWVTVRKMGTRECKKITKGSITDSIHWVQPFRPSTVAQTVTLLIYSGDCHFESRPLHRLSWGITQFSSVPPGKFRYSTWNQATTAPCHILPSALPAITQSCDVMWLQQLGPRWTR
jgi:hypothetical protein